MRFHLTIDGSGAAFEEAPLPELSGLIETVAGRVAAGDTGGKVVDSNGNTTGEWAITDRWLRVTEREFEIVSDTVDTDLVYTDGYMPDGNEQAPHERVSCEPDTDDIAEGVTAVDVAAKWFEDNGPGPWEPDVSPGAARWFIAREELSGGATDGQEVSVHLEGFSADERAQVTRRVYR